MSTQLVLPPGIVQVPASSGGSGITQLTGAVTAGPGSGSQAATVVKIGAGDTTVTAAGEAVAGAANAGAQRTALGLGTAATTAATDYATAAQGATADAALPATSPSAASKIVPKVTATDYTVGTTDPNELYGGVVYVTSAATITLPAVAVGANVTVVTVGAIAVSVDPNAADLIVRDGTAQADGEKITNLSTAGDVAVLTYYNGTGWFASTNSWTNGG